MIATMQNWRWAENCENGTLEDHYVEQGEETIFLYQVGA